MQAIDLSPPCDWLEVFPLSKPPFKKLNNSVEWSVRVYITRHRQLTLPKGVAPPEKLGRIQGAVF
jgi:hypothetical protein